MLRTLVNKFKSQSLTEDMGPVRKSARLNASATTLLVDERDSGTESDDEELQRIDTELTTASTQDQSSEACERSSNTGDSHHSTLLISELDTNSCDSMGCESGIALRESDSDSTTAEQLGDDYQSKSSGVETVQSAGAFRPVRRERSVSDQQQTTVIGFDVELGAAHQRAGQVAGEKRKWSNKSTSFANDNDDELAKTDVSSYTAKLRSASGLHNLTMPSITRETLTAARRMPIRLLIPSSVPNAITQEQHHDPSCNKRVRSRAGGAVGTCSATTDAARPSLDFEKMLERMMKPNVKRNNKSTADNTSKTKRSGWACSHRHCVGTAIVCAQADCVFRPVEPATSIGGALTSVTSNKKENA
jgi:hypothetical protein